MFMAYFAAWWDHPKVDHWRPGLFSVTCFSDGFYHRAVDHYCCLVVLTCSKTILKNDGVRQWVWDCPIYEMENKIHVPNHQPVAYCHVLIFSVRS